MLFRWRHDYDTSPLWTYKWCVKHKRFIFYCRSFESKRAARRFLSKKHRKFHGFYLERTVVGV